MSKTVETVKMADLIPKTMADDPKILAICAGIDAADAYVTGAIRKTLVLADIDDLQSDAVDLLALEFHADYYNQELPVETRRNLVKSSGFLHMFQGTPGSVERLTSIVLGDSFIQEWFEYGGAPYTFRLMTTNTDVTDDQFQEIVRMLTASVNVRSHMDGFYYYGIFTEPIYYGVGVIEKTFDFILCGTKPTPAMVGKIANIPGVARVQIFKEAFGIGRCGPNLTGVLPSRSTIGVIYPVKSDVTILISPSLITIPASGRTPVGTLPEASTIGEIYEVKSQTSAQTDALPFDSDRCGTELLGKTKYFPTIGEMNVIGATTSDSSESEAFNIAMCGAEVSGNVSGADAVGAISAVGTEVSLSDTAIQFEIQRCGTEMSGSSAGTSMAGGVCAVITAISFAGISQLIKYAECGSLKAATGCKNTIN